MNYCDVAVVGAGPAGLAAATYLMGTGLKSVVIAPKLSGKVGYQFHLRGQEPVDTVWGASLVHQFMETVEAKGDVLQNEVAQIEKEGQRHFFLTLGDGERVRARAVILATGARPQRLYIPGEQALQGRGVSYSAVSHIPLFHDRNCLVVGYGERALVALLALATVAKHVYFVPTVALEQTDKRRKQIEGHPNITIFPSKELIRIKGEAYVESVQLLDSDRSITNLEVDGVFVAMDLLRNNSMVRNLIAVDPTTGTVAVNQGCETAVPNLFAAGDITDVCIEQVPIAVGEGIKAAISAWRSIVTTPVVATD